MFATRRAEADAYYATVIPAALDADHTQVMRQSLAGLLWSKQYYEYDVHRWLREHGVNPWAPDAASAPVRNVPWFHMVAGDIISMPDKWEYPWFAAWDLAFHCAPLSLVDVDFAKEQVELLLRTRYMHPTGRSRPTSGTSPTSTRPSRRGRRCTSTSARLEIRGEGDRQFLQRVFQRLLTNFSWWVNRKDPDGRNLYQGGFLGLDNIGIFDRSAPLPGGGTLAQADGTAWMALYCQWMLQMALELARDDDAYLDMALKFVSHFEWIAIALNPPAADTPLWDEQDGFFYDVMRMPDGATFPLKVRSLVGLLAAVRGDGLRRGDGRSPSRADRARAGVRRALLRRRAVARAPARSGRARGGGCWRSSTRRSCARSSRSCSTSRSSSGRTASASISRRHLDEPCRFEWGGELHEVRYLPAESDTGMFGGNSNWRGPVWFPMNLVILRALVQLHRYYGDGFKVEYPTGSGRELTPGEVAAEIASRLTQTFTEDEDGRRPVFGGLEKFQNDPHWHDLLLFHEYFHGDNGAGLGASHQTGWTGTVALLMLMGAGLGARPGRAGGRGALSDAPARPPDDLRDQHGRLAPRPLARRRDRRGVGRAGGAARRRRLAHGRVASARRPGSRSRSTTRV